LYYEFDPEEVELDPTSIHASLKWKQDVDGLPFTSTSSMQMRARRTNIHPSILEVIFTKKPGFPWYV